jgi:hypothetical protein
MEPRCIGCSQQERCSDLALETNSDGSNQCGKEVTRIQEYGLPFMHRCAELHLTKVKSPGVARMIAISERRPNNHASPARIEHCSSSMLSRQCMSPYGCAEEHSRDSSTTTCSQDPSVDLSQLTCSLCMSPSMAPKGLLLPGRCNGWLYRCVGCKVVCGVLWQGR